MKYNMDYYILCYDPKAKNKRRIEKVKGSKIVYGFVDYSNDYELLPKLFIYKDGDRFVLSDAMSGLQIWRSYKLKELKEWAEDKSIVYEILKRYNTDTTREQINMFQSLINGCGY